ncbi:unnamed protein product [Brugia timori]|uniref:Uncharacterized protein n=1 Tax=Brugia timori TaxID=42155 RepID=A0A3P7TVB1_9BILA|nr:unnamed protein product [Brugia timori]
MLFVLKEGLVFDPHRRMKFRPRSWHCLTYVDV